MKITNSSETEHVEKRNIYIYIYIYISVISNNKNNKYSSNNNDLRDVQHRRLEKKLTLIWIRNWFITHLKNTSTTQTVSKRKEKIMGYITPAMGYCPRNG